MLLFDFPRDPIEYMRRVGRTARAGRKGVVTVLAWGRQVRKYFSSICGHEARTCYATDGSVEFFCLATGCDRFVWLGLRETRRTAMPNKSRWWLRKRLFLVKFLELSPTTDFGALPRWTFRLLGVDHIYHRFCKLTQHPLRNNSLHSLFSTI